MARLHIFAVIARKHVWEKICKFMISLIRYPFLKRASIRKIIARHYYPASFAILVEARCKIRFRRISANSRATHSSKVTRRLIASSSSLSRSRRLWTLNEEKGRVWRRGRNGGGLIPGVCNSNWIYHRGNYEASERTDGPTNERTNEWKGGLDRPGLADE